MAAAICLSRPETVGSWRKFANPRGMFGLGLEF
jgi:hypothetical protein